MMKTMSILWSALLLGALPCLADATTNEVDAALIKKLQSIIIPTVDFKQTPIPDVLRSLAKTALKLDPDKKGVKIVLREKTEDVFTFEGKDVSVYKALKIVTTMSGLTLTVEKGTVVVKKAAAKPVL